MTCDYWPLKFSYYPSRSVPASELFFNRGGGGHIASTTDLELDSVFLHPAGEKSSGLEKSE